MRIATLIALTTIFASACAATGPAHHQGHTAAHEHGPAAPHEPPKTIRINNPCGERTASTHPDLDLELTKVTHEVTEALGIEWNGCMVSKRTSPTDFAASVFEAMPQDNLLIVDFFVHDDTIRQGGLAWAYATIFVFVKMDGKVVRIWTHKAKGGFYLDMEGEDDPERKAEHGAIMSGLKELSKKAALFKRL